MVIFKTFMRRATANEIEEMVGFGERFVRLLVDQREPALHGIQNGRFS